MAFGAGLMARIEMSSTARSGSTAIRAQSSAFLPRISPSWTDSFRERGMFQTAGFSADPAPPPARSTQFMPRSIGRLKPRITVDQAQAWLTAMATQICHDYPTDYPVTPSETIPSFRRTKLVSIVGCPARPTLWTGKDSDIRNPVRSRR